MWIVFAFLSAALLGFYDVFKKKSLNGNDVMMVLLLNCLFSSVIFLPVAAGYVGNTVPEALFGGWAVQRWIVLKAFIVLSSWICGYYAMKHLPITLVGPVNATRPVLVLLGALLLFGERLNAWQWAGVIVAMAGFYMLKVGGKREGIDFMHNRWILCLIAAALLGAVSGLYDKFLLSPSSGGGMGLDRLAVQTYFNFYQLAIMAVLVGSRYVMRGKCSMWLMHAESDTSFQWRWWIPLISLFICMADIAYFYSLSLDGAMISVVSMVRRSSVVVSFMVGAFLFHEKQLFAKAVDLAVVVLSMILLYLGTK